MRDASSLYRGGSYGTALALAALAREELGRSNILFDLRAKVVADEAVTQETIRLACDDHVTKQDWAVVSTVMSVEDRNSGLGKLLQTRMNAAPSSEEWRAADREIAKLDELQRKRAKHDRHEQRMRALYVEPDASGRGWNRPSTVSQRAAYDFLNHATNDYSVQLQKLHPELLKGSDDQLLNELLEWTERPKLPDPERLPLLL